MPGFDGTGPSGRGPMTGGRRGRCVPPPAAEGESSAPVLRGAGRGGISWGCGCGFCGGRARGRG
ncbi:MULTISPECIES: DUF5320 domain-containing protein [unclassified Methanoculleus]|jgi:hypothetical protein|uniref:DUF5320 domain-containing protein n=1 Tax=Methanoculleus palmolei TaxID=72612 RepID=A0ABD8AA22_9EURY|nr:DUF5320 domain-containing protein [Methanoculleus sp. UBA377]WOX56371.1 DUF5320 domain-containing protein [Methanoculleus palmolei]